MTFDESFIKIVTAQKELQEMQQELIIKTVNDQGGVITDERVKEHYNFEDESSREFDSRVTIDLLGRHGDIEVDIYSIRVIESQWGPKLEVIGLTENGDEAKDRLYSDSYSAALIFISNYFNKEL